MHFFTAYYRVYVINLSTLADLLLMKHHVNFWYIYCHDCKLYDYSSVIPGVVFMGTLDSHVILMFYYCLLLLSVHPA